MMNRRVLLSVAAMAMLGCDPDVVEPEDGGVETDAGTDAAVEVCARGLECEDALFCTVHQCMPGVASADARGCVLLDGPCAGGMTCDEANERCREADCSGGGDRDGDGHAAIACGGDDCDDDDATVFPGAAEICDSDGVDDDCNPTTLSSADGDVDLDSYVSAACCNRQASGAMRCGNDCDDALASTHPDAIEVCNDVDDDCDTLRDEGVSGMVYRDADLDGFGDPEDAAVACFGSIPEGYGLNAGDCDDDDALRFPGAGEHCNGEDDDCDTRVDESALEIGSREHCTTCGDACQFACVDAVAGCDLPAQLALTTDGERGSASCARLESGAVYCWGANVTGQLGDGTNLPTHVPVRAGTGTLDAIAAGHQHVCGVGSLGIFCWGANDAGQLGTGDLVSRPSPTVADPRAALPVTAGRQHSCAMVGADGGSFRCAGSNVALQLGLPPSVTESVTFALPADVDMVTSAAAGEAHTCVLHTDGSITCWGSNDLGQLGRAIDGGGEPALVTGLISQTGLVSGEGHTCSLGGGDMLCWGADHNGQLGDATVHPACPDGQPACSPVPVAVALPGVSAIAAGGHSTCAIYDGGKVACWGLYIGEGGSGAAGGYVSATPATAPSISDATIVATGGHHQCVIRGARREVWCWGANLRGEVGLPFPAVIDPTDPDLLVEMPVLVPSPD